MALLEEEKLLLEERVKELTVSLEKALEQERVMCVCVCAYVHVCVLYTCVYVRMMACVHLCVYACMWYV